MTVKNGRKKFLCRVAMKQRHKILLSMNIYGHYCTRWLREHAIFIFMAILCNFYCGNLTLWMRLLHFYCYLRFVCESAILFSAWDWPNEKRILHLRWMYQLYCNHFCCFFLQWTHTHTYQWNQREKKKIWGNKTFPIVWGG